MGILEKYPRLIDSRPPCPAMAMAMATTMAMAVSDGGGDVILLCSRC